MSNVKQCRQCGRLFESLGSNLCPRCMEDMEKDFVTVKEYVYDHSDANVFDISNETGVPEKTVLEFLREGRLSMSGADLHCEECGASITTGRYCSECQNKLEIILKSAYRPPASKKESNTPPSGRMHFDYRKRNNS